MDKKRINIALPMPIYRTIKACAGSNIRSVHGEIVAALMAQFKTAQEPTEVVNTKTGQKLKF